MNEHIVLPTQDRFLWCGGAHKRFERVCRNDEWWWQQCGDWGLGIMDGVLLGRLPLMITMRVDISERSAGSVSWSWVSDVWPRRMGDDGLPFDQKAQISVHVGREAIQIAGQCIENSTRFGFHDGKLVDGPFSLRCIVEDHLLRVSVGEKENHKFSCEIDTPRPGLLCVGAGANSCREANARFGTIELNRSID